MKKLRKLWIVLVLAVLVALAAEMALQKVRFSRYEDFYKKIQAINEKENKKISFFHQCLKERLEDLSWGVAEQVRAQSIKFVLVEQSANQERFIVLFMKAGQKRIMVWCVEKNRLEKTNATRLAIIAEEVALLAYFYLRKELANSSPEEPKESPVSNFSKSNITKSL